MNGAGKTTQLQIILGKLQADSGEVVKAKRNMRIAYLAQVYHASGELLGGGEGHWGAGGCKLGHVPRAPGELLGSCWGGGTGELLGCGWDAPGEGGGLGNWSTDWATHGLNAHIAPRPRRTTPRTGLRSLTLLSPGAPHPQSYRSPGAPHPLQEFDVVATRTVREEFYSVYDEQTRITRRQEAISQELEAVGEDMDRMQELIDEMEKLRSKVWRRG